MARRNLIQAEDTITSIEEKSGVISEEDAWLEEEMKTDEEADLIIERLKVKDTVYAPNIDCSNIHHKIVGEVVKEMFDDVVFYDTYKDSWGTTGKGKKVDSTLATEAIKVTIMEEYTSQIERPQTAKHFERCWDEFIS